MAKLLTWILVLLLIASSVLAIGVSPIRKVVDFEPEKSLDLSVKIRNEGDTTIKAVMYARGDLAHYVGIKDSLVTVTPQEKDVDASYVLTLPTSLDRPGIYKTDLVVLEYPESFGTGKENIVSAQASVVSELWVRVPYPGKYAEGTVYIQSGNVNEPVKFLVSVLNFGKERISQAQATISIYGATYEKIGEVTTNAIALDPQGQSQISAEWMANVHPGRYHAVIELNYDDKKQVIEQNFDVGNLLITIKKIDVHDFALGQVAVLDMYLSSEWNEPIPNVYGEVTVLDKEGSAYGTFKTASIDMPAMGEGMLKGYWDTNGLGVGAYDLRILIHYGEKVTEKLVDAEVGIDSIRTSLSPTAQVVAGGGGWSRDTLLILIILILVIVNIVWFVLYARRKR